MNKEKMAIEAMEDGARMIIRAYDGHKPSLPGSYRIFASYAREFVEWQEGIRKLSTPEAMGQCIDPE